MQSRRALVLLATLTSIATLAPAFAGGERDGTLFYLGLRGSQVVRMNADGSNRRVIVEAQNSGPDGIVVDASAGHVYWTNMGRVNLDDGSVMRADLDGGNVTTVVPAGGTFTPKQLKLDREHGKLYWSDREGMRIMRANLDGSKVETLVVAGTGDAERKDQTRWCVGIALDVPHGKIYWTQKGGDNAHKGMIKRANLEIPKGEDAAHRSDIEVLFADLPEPIDMDLDLRNGMMYWTDRGDNTISRAPMNPQSQSFNPAKRADREILVRDLKEAIGVALDLKNKRMFYTDLGGNVGVATLDGKRARILQSDQGALTGIAYLEEQR